MCACVSRRRRVSMLRLGSKHLVSHTQGGWPNLRKPWSYASSCALAVKVLVLLAANNFQCFQLPILPSWLLTVLRPRCTKIGQNESKIRRHPQSTLAAMGMSSCLGKIGLKCTGRIACWVFVWFELFGGDQIKFELQECKTSLQEGGKESWGRQMNKGRSNTVSAQGN